MDQQNNNNDRKSRRKGSSLELSTMMYGKVPPQAKDLEEAVLGAIMLESRAFDIASDIITANSFYVEANQRIFNSMVSLKLKGKSLDLLTLVEQLKTTEELDLVGGPYYVTKLTNNVVSAAHIEAHCRIIQEKFIKREIIRVGGEMIGNAYEDSTDVFELLDKVEEDVYGIANNHVNSDYSSMQTVITEEMAKIEETRQKDESIIGVPSGFSDMDKVTHGWQNTDLIIIAARPSVGKTAFALNLARNASLHSEKPIPIGMFSLEMSKGQLVRRILSAQSKIWLDTITTAKMEDYQMKQLYERGVYPLDKSMIYIDDQAAINIMELRAKARRMKSKHKVGMIIIDYLQLMGGDDKRSNREQEISKISRNLKGLAKELQIPVIALSQLSRDLEKRSGDRKQPQLSDLRESGAIEQDADVVIFLYKPDDEDVKRDPELMGTGTAKIAKNRNGKLESFAFRIDNDIQMWEEIGVLTKNWQPSNNTPGSVWKPVSEADAHFEKQYTSKGSVENEFNEELPFN